MSNLVAFVDNNDFQSLGRTSETHPSFYPLVDKFDAFGWECAEVDGHDSAAIFDAVSGREGGRPFMLVGKTTKGKGISYMENVPIWHYRSPNQRNTSRARWNWRRRRIMRNTFSEALYKAATTNPDIYIVVADISPAGSMAKFRDQYPDRFINVGVAEQSMIGICAGLALKGCQPFAYTIATFSLYRPFEMVRDDLCYQNLPVTVVGMGAGVIYSTLGGTHHTQEDIAIAGAMPNMQIIAPCDPAECTEATAYCASQKEGPVYLRIGKAGEPNFTDKAVDPWKFGKLRYIKRGTDVCILSYGVIMQKAMQLAARFEAQGKSVSVVSCHTLKPLDIAGIREALAAPQHVIVIEEHAPQGGLAPRTKQIAWDIQARCRLDTFTLQDAFIHNYGSHDDLLGGARPGSRRHRGAGGGLMNEIMPSGVSASAAPAAAPLARATLAIHGGERVRKTPMPARLALGDGERQMIQSVLDYYRERNLDPGYEGHFEKMYCRAFAEMMGGGYADAVATGTSALYIAVAALNLPKGSEVLFRRLLIRAAWRRSCSTGSSRG